MEINTTMKTCPNVHHYDGARHASCPFCEAGGGFTPTEPLGGGAFTPTEPLGGGAFTPTEPPSGGAFTPTEPLNGGGSGGGVNPFSVETMIGGEQPGGGQSEPVVGWLVCIEGPVRGTDYRVHAGYNYIGRDSGDIRIRGDQQISRQNHAMIAFDSTELTYFVGPAAGRNLIKVNGKTVLNAVEIQSYDVISIGTTKLIFVALCSEKFRWGRETSNG